MQYSYNIISHSVFNVPILRVRKRYTDIYTRAEIPSHIYAKH